MKKYFTFLSGIIMLLCLTLNSYAQADTIPPVVLNVHAEFTPTELTDSVDAVFTLTYSEDVQLADTFTIVTHSFIDEVSEEFGSYDTTEVVVENNVITVTPNHSFRLADKYDLVVGFGSVSDSAGNFAEAFTHTFTADGDAPEVVDFEMALTSNEGNDSVSALFTLTYSENIQLYDSFFVATHVYENGTWLLYKQYDDTEVSVQGNVLTINPHSMFSYSQRYELVIVWGAVLDLEDNPASSFTYVFTPDTTPPEVVDFEVFFTDTEFADSSQVSFTLTYNEDVKLAPTSIFETQIRNAGIWEVYEVFMDTNIVVSGNTLTLTSTRLYSASDSYNLVVTSGSIRDLVDNPAGSFSDVFLLDTVPPKLTDISPDLEQPVPADASFTFTFDEVVRVPEIFGFYTYYWDNDSAKYIELERLTKSQVVVEGNVVTFNPAVPLMTETRSQIVLTSGSVLDMEGNIFLNVTGGDTVTYVSERFWAVDSGVAAVSFLPADGDSVSSIPDVLTITFSEVIMPSDTAAVDSADISSYVYLRQDNLDIEHVAVLDTSSKVITIEPFMELSYGTTYTFGFTSGLVNEAGDSITAMEATFTILDSTGVVNHYAIAEINGDSAASPYLGQVVQVTGTITGIYPDEGFFVQDENAAGSGIWANYSETGMLNLGEGITITGMVEVINGVTALSVQEADSAEVPLTIEPIGINVDSDTLPMYLNVLVQVVNARASAADEEGGWNVFAQDDADSIAVGNAMHAFTPVEGSFYHITGVVTGWDSIYSIEPRTEADVIEAGDSLYAITDIHGDTVSSPFLGQEVRINATVTAVIAGEGFYAQDENSAGSGIWVQLTDTLELMVGDGVDVTGMVEELNGVTHIVAGDVISIAAPLTVEPLVLNFGTDSIPMYEWVLVQITNARATEANDEGEWNVNSPDDADSLLVGNEIYAFAPLENNIYHITGVVTVWDSIYKIVPRTEADVMEEGDSIYAISEIHGDSINSPYLGQEVRINGTVTAVYAGEGFYAQDENAAGSGIWVQYTDTLELMVGDGVDVTGVVEEVNGVTSIVAGEVTSITAPLTVEPVVITFGIDSIPMYQGVLVQITNARASVANTEGEWNLFSEMEADSVIIGNWFYAHTPVADNFYDLTGVVTFRDNVYRVEPRFETDVVDVTDPTSVDLTPDIEYNIYPNPFGSYIKISNNDRLTRVIISNITGQRVMDVTYPDAELNTSHLIGGVYIINLYNEKNLVKTSRIIKR
jgi:hypothetical protein